MEVTVEEKEEVMGRAERGRADLDGIVVGVDVCDDSGGGKSGNNNGRCVGCRSGVGGDYVMGGGN